MGQAGRFLRRIGRSEGYTAAGYAHWCPACECMHAFAVDAPFRNGAQWSFNGSLEAPSFSPSMNIRTGRFADPTFKDDDGDLSSVCHYFLRSGAELSASRPDLNLDPARAYLWFLGDCTHALKDQVVALPELPPSHRDH
jgi:uncharacterized protein DUF6527